MLRADLAAIADMVEPNTRVLDVGCGDGALLEHLAQTRGVDGRGIELSQQNVNACVARGLSVLQGDADTDLDEYPSQAFGVVILSQTIQATRSPAKVLTNLLRIGKHTVVSFPNFGHWRVRLSLLSDGQMPRTRALDYAWYETPNIHLCTIRDFIALAYQSGAEIEKALAVDADGAKPIRANSLWPNLMAEGAIFFMNRRGSALGG